VTENFKYDVTLFILGSGVMDGDSGDEGNDELTCVSNKSS